MKRAECSRTEEIWSTPRRELEGPLAAHASTCAACAEALAAVRGYAENAARGAVDRSIAQRKAVLRGSLLGLAAKMTQAPKRSGAPKVAAMAGLFAAGAAIASLLLGDRTPKAALPSRGAAAEVRAIIRSHPGARFERYDEARAERVRLTQGTVEVEIEGRPIERPFYLDAGHAELEARESWRTVFAASAEHGLLAEILVIAGRVELRQDGATLILSAGDLWRPTRPEKRPIPAARAIPVPSHRNTPAADLGAAPGPPEAELAFGRGMDALRQGRFSEAAEAFARTVALDRAGPLAEDARYQEARALAGGGEPQRAAEVLRAFLGEFPGSVRHGEASVMLGWILLDGGDRPGARAAFQAGVADLLPKVRASARSGLEALDGP